MRSRASPRTAAWIASLVVAGCATVPADEDPVQIKLHDLDTRLTRIDRIASNQSLLDMSNQLEALRADVRAMHNDVDELSHNLEATRKQQRDLYADLDARLRVVEGRAGTAYAPGGSTSSATASPTSSPTASAAAATGADGPDKAAYQGAFELLKTSQYDQAIVAFQKYLATYPDSTYADNAQYWLGEAYYVNKSFPEAQQAFQRVIDRYPQSRKIPDALLKIAFCKYESKEYQSARETLLQVIARYPEAPSARLAQQRLDKMTAESH